MSLRETAADLIDRGSSVEWLAGMSLKLSFELGFSIVAASVIAFPIAAYTPVGGLRAYVGSATPAAVAVVGTVLVFSNFAACEFTSASTRTATSARPPDEER